jgi:CheY-like chemotaxis protein
MSTKPVLIADPDPSVLERVMMLLVANGYVVRGANTSEEAIDRAEINLPRLLIINPQMPSLSGVEAASRISRKTSCKVIFLTELAKDVDFREVLRGLRQQGCDCSAVDVPFADGEFVAEVHRTIGPPRADIEKQEDLPNPETDGKAPLRPPRPAPGDYEALLEIVEPQLYDHNAFRLTGLSVDTSLRDISKAAERLEMIAKGFGVAEAAPNSFSKAPPAAEEVRVALQCLKVPEQRLLQEFFWFWPTTRRGNHDPALASLDAGDLTRAEKIWGELAGGQRELKNVLAQIEAARSEHEKKELLQLKKTVERKTAIATHNLAVLNHIRALSHTPSGSSKLSIQCTDPVAAWRASLNCWSRLHKQHEFWNALADRIREINDPRLSIETAEMIWTSLPLALLLLNAQIAVASAEAGDFERASIQKQLMDHSGFEMSCVKGAISRKLAPLQHDLARLCQSVEERALKSPETAADVVRYLFDEKKRYLQTFNYLLGVGDPSRDAAHDLVAGTARTCLVAYLNKTENWEAGLQLFQECLILANSNSLRSRLEEDHETLTRNAARQRAARRTQSTAAPTRHSPAPNQPSQRQPPIPASRSGLTPAGRRVLFGFLALVGLFILIAVSSNSNSSTAPPEQSAPVTTPTNMPPDAGTPSNVESTSVSTTGYPLAKGESPTAPKTIEPRQSTESAQLKAEIEENRNKLRQMEADLSDYRNRIDQLSSQIDADDVKLEEMKHGHDMGEDVDVDLYEGTRRRHNSAVETHNELVEQYNSSLRSYKSLLSTTNEMIDGYNAHLRSQ